MIDGVGAYRQPVAILCEISLHGMLGLPHNTECFPINDCKFLTPVIVILVGLLRLGEGKRTMFLLY